MSLSSKNNESAGLEVWFFALDTVNWRIWLDWEHTLKERQITVSRTKSINQQEIKQYCLCKTVNWTKQSENIISSVFTLSWHLVEKNKELIHLKNTQHVDDLLVAALKGLNMKRTLT